MRGVAVLLILSTQWAGGGIETHYGRLPIGFLPFGSERFLHAQRRVAPAWPCVVTIPEEFQLSAREQQEFQLDGVQFLAQPASLSVGQSLADALRRCAPKGPLQVLLGGTLAAYPNGIALTEGGVAVAAGPASSLRFEPAGVPGERFSSSAAGATALAVCGHFHLADGAVFAEALRTGDLSEAFNAYDEKRPMHAVLAKSSVTIGTLASYVDAKSERLVTRAFNFLSRKGGLLVKSSDDAAKMAAEATWYETLPSPLQPFVASYHGRDLTDRRSGYQLEFLDLPTLGELSAFGRLPDSDWETIMDAAHELLCAFHEIRPAPSSPYAWLAFAGAFHRSMVQCKTRSRVERYITGVGGDFAVTLNGRRFPPLLTVADRLIGMVRPTRPEDIRFWHGDYHYGNLFFDARKRRVLCVDPRGRLDDGTITSFGDRRYDVAKLAHSVIGHYDRIVLGAATLERDDVHVWRFDVAARPGDSHLAARFLERCRNDLGLDEAEILPLSALMFLSMLPLHADRPPLQLKLIAAGLSLAARLGVGA